MGAEYDAHTAASCTTLYIQIIFEEALAAQMLEQAVITNQANQETAILIEITPPSPLQQKFDALVMCNFTPRKPSELPVSRWVSCDRPPFEPGALRSR